MTNNKLSPVTVYVPIKPKPDEKNDPIKAKAVSYVTGETLEPQEKYVFDREALEKIISRAWEEGVKNGYDNCKNGYSNENTKQQTINLLFKQ